MQTNLKYVCVCSAQILTRSLDNCLLNIAI